MKRTVIFALAIFALFWATTATSSDNGQSQVYVRTNLVSDIAGVARFTDPNLVNAWGLGFGPTSPFWIADNNAGVSTLYNGKGQAFPVGSPLVVTIPSPTAPTGGTPTGLVFNNTTDFVVADGSKSGASVFIFSSEDGTILGWSPAVSVTSAIIAKPAGGGAVYKGLAIANTSKGNFIYATNFNSGFVEMYDKNFHLVKTFTDSNVDPGFAPFGIQNIGGDLFVTFALQNDMKHDDVAGPGNGFVDIFDTNGMLIRRFASKGTLNSPWGLALAPQQFGKFGNHILVGDFGDGRINAFDLGGSFAGQLIDPEGNPLTINGLWALEFGNGAPNNGARNKLFFTAGIADESHGLFGFIKSRPGNGNGEEDNED
jgi:uncharacterized protein (TIGR03118 family)